MNKNLARAIDYLAFEDADVINEMENGVCQISLGLIAHTFDMDSYKLLEKVWDRFAQGRGYGGGVYHVITEVGVFRVHQSFDDSFWVWYVLEPHRNLKRVNLGKFSSKRAANSWIKKLDRDYVETMVGWAREAA